MAITMNDQANPTREQTSPTPADDVGDERNHLGQGLEEAEYALKSADDKEYAQEPQDPEPHLVGRVLALVHLVSRQHARLEHIETLPVLGGERNERVAAHL